MKVSIYKNSKENSIIFLSFILLLGFGLRIYKLGERSLWFDESGFIFLKSGSLLESIRYIFNFTKFTKGRFPDTIAYDIFVLFWSEFAKNEFMLRLSSVIFGTFSILLIYYLGKSFFGRKAGLMSAFLLAVSPFHIYYSQEFRMYSLISLLTLFTVYFMKKFIETGKTGNIFSYAIFHLLNIYIITPTILYLFAEVIFFLINRRKYFHLIKKWLIAHLIILFFLIPLMILIFMQLKFLSGDLSNTLSKNILDGIVITTKSLWAPLFTLKNFFLGYNAIFPVWISALILFSILVFWGVFKKNQNKREELCLCLSCSFVPLFILYLFRRLFYVDRYIIPSSLFLYLIAMKGLSQLKKRNLVIVTVLILILFSLTLKNYYQDVLPIMPEEQRVGVHVKKDHKGAARYIAENSQDNDFIFHTCPNTIVPFEFYFRNGNSLNMKIPYEKRWIVLEFSKENGNLLPCDYLNRYRFIDKSNVFSLEGHQRVWLVFSRWNFEEVFEPGSREGAILEWMDKHYKRTHSENFRGIILYLYEKR